jgi:hypothetical protein
VGTTGAFSISDWESVQPSGRTPLWRLPWWGCGDEMFARNVAARSYGDGRKIARVDAGYNLQLTMTVLICTNI